MDESTRLTKTKEQWAKARRGGEEREVFYEGDDRLPPGRVARTSAGASCAMTRSVVF